MAPVTLWQKLTAGLFVLLTVGVWLFFGIALSEKESGRKYHLYIDQSVRGLAPSSLVCFNGIPVGKVTKLSNDFSRNKVRVDILISDPQVKISDDYKTEEGEVKPGTRAEVVTYLFTGLQYVNLTGGYAKYPKLPQGEEIPVVRNDLTQKMQELFSEENIAHLNKVVDNLDKMTSQINEKMLGEGPQSVLPQVRHILQNVERFTGDDNYQQVNRVLTNVEELTSPDKLQVERMLRKFENRIDKLLHESHQLTVKLSNVIDSGGKQEDVASVVKNMNQLLESNQKDIQSLIANLESLSYNLDQELRVLLAEAKTTMKTFNHFLHKEVYATNIEIRKAFQEFSYMLQILKAKPNALLWGAGVKGK